MRLIIGFLVIAGVLVAGLWMTSMPVSAAESGMGGEILYTKPVKGVLFSHKTHVEDTGLDCNVCHDKLFQMAALNAQESADFTMKSLYGGKYCGACHDGKMAFASSTQCARCHVGAKGLAKAQKLQKGAPAK